MKYLFLLLSLVMGIENIYSENLTKYLKHSSGMILGLGSDNHAVLKSANASDIQPMEFLQQSDGAYAITIKDKGTTRYLSLGTTNGWSTYYQTSFDSHRSKYSIEKVDERYIRLKNASTGKYLGTDATTPGSYAFSDKSGTDALHHWYLVDNPKDEVAPTTYSYLISPAQQQQICEGWGVSLCWWANMCGHWSDEKLDQIIDWLVSPTGLNMNIFRYNIGGGDDPNNTNCTLHHMGNGKGLRAEMEGFLDGPGENYIWERDEAQRRVMLKIHEKRPDAIFEAFSNSAPWWMTYSGCCSGAVNPGDDNLKPEYYEAFCHYLVDVCKHYRDEYGIEFRTLEPFNEPNTTYWGCNGGQEGCHFSSQSQVALLRVLYPILQESGLKTVISASDETSVATAVSTLKTITSSGITNMVGQWNTHTYSGNDRACSQFGTLARQTGKPVWMSEVGSGGSGIGGNLALMQRMFRDIHYIMPSAWIDWQYIEEYGDQWCMVNAKFNDENSATRVKSYYIRSQVTRFIQPGYHFVPSLSSQALAAISPERDRLVVVLINSDAAKSVHHISLPYTTINGSVEVYQTTQNYNVARRHDVVDTEDNILTATLAPLSITTLLIPVHLEKTTFDLAEGNTYLVVPQSNIEMALDAQQQKVIISKLNPESETQLWTLIKDSNESTYTFINEKNEYISYRNGEYALSTRSTTGGNIYQQSFSLLPVEDYFYRIMNGKYGFDLQSNKLTEGTTVGMYTYGNSLDADTRNWRLIRVPGKQEGTGINQLPATGSDTDKIYFNLTGQRISRPQHGVNIMLRDGKAIKILHR